jgi:O-antigen/teichoic acid export membrane protein
MTTAASTENSDRDRRPRARHGSFRAGFAFGILSFLTIAVFSVVSTIIVSRLYGVSIVGEFALVSAPVGALWVLSTAKEQAALIKEITRLSPRHPRVTQLFSAVFTFSAGLTLMMSLIAAVVSWLAFRGPLHQPELVTPACVSIAGYALITNTAWNIDSIFSSFVAGRQLFWVRLHEAISFIAIAVALGFVWRSVWGLVIATIGGSLTALVHRTIWIRHFVQPRLSRSEYRAGLGALPGLLRFGLKITPGSIAEGISQQAGVWAVATVGSVAIVGAYSRAETIPQRFQQVNIRIVEVLYPTLVGRRGRGDGTGFDRALIDAIRYALAGLLLIAAVFGGAAHSILEIFGPGFPQAAPALALLILYPALTAVTATLTQALFAVDRPGMTSVAGVSRFAATIGLILLLTPRIGIVGPPIGLLVGFVLDVAWRAVVLRPFLSAPLRATWPLRERFALVSAYAGGFGGAKLLEHAFPSLAGLPFCLAGGTMVYAALFLLCGGLNERDRGRCSEALAAARRGREQRALARQPTGAAEPDGGAA